MKTFGELIKTVTGYFVPKRVTTPGVENYVYRPYKDVITDPLGGPGYPMTAYCESYPVFGPRPVDWYWPQDNSPVIDGLEGVPVEQFEADPVLDMNAYLQSLAEHGGPEAVQNG